MVVNELSLTSSGGTSRPVAAIGAMAVLAVLDLVGAVLARRYADHRSVLALVGGCLVFGLLFWVYGKSLAYAELATVTFGWIVMIQVGVMLLECFHEGNAIPPDRIGVMAAIVVLQGYLILAP